MPGITVEIGADIAELLSKLKDAGAGFDEFTARTKALAEQMLGTSDDAKNALAPGLDGLAGVARQAGDAFLFLKKTAEQAFKQAKEALGFSPAAEGAAAQTPAPAPEQTKPSSGVAHQPAPLQLQPVPQTIEFPKLTVDDSAIKAFKALDKESRKFSKQLSNNVKELAAQDAQWKKFTAPFVSAFDQGIKSVIKGTQTLDQAMKGIAQSILSTFLDMGLKKAENWAVEQLRELTMTETTETAKTAAVTAGEASRLAAKQAGTTAGAVAEAAAGSATVMGDAHKAFSGAYSAVVGIPIIGPILAPIAGATAFAAVAAYDIFSAEGGYDIPTGLNPMTQLHQKEMVLPAQYAEVIRTMAGDENGNSGAGTHHHYNVDLSGATFGSGIKPNQMKDMVVGALKQAHRELRFA